MTRFRAAATMTALTLAVTAGGCDSFLDVNDDPNNPQSVAMELVLPGMLIRFGHGVLAPAESRYGNLTGPTAWGSMWTMQWSHNADDHTYEEHRLYEVGNLDANGFWNAGYADVMQEAVNIMAASEASGQMQFHGIAKFMFAWTATLLTDVYGPIPFTEAFDTENRTPAYNSQQEVYAAAFTLIDEAIAEMQTTHPFPVDYTDIVYKGDMGKWVRLANSVKARMHLRLAYAPGENTAERAQSALTALAAGMASPTDAPLFLYDGEDANNPFDHFSNEGYGEISRASKYMVDLLQSTNDPRIHTMVRRAHLICPAGGGYQREECTLADTLAAPVYRGHPNAMPGEPDSAISRIGEFFGADSADNVLFVYEETKFIEAEARLNLSGAAAADAPYREGVRLNMERLEVPQADIDVYMAALPPLTAAANPLEAIITQKYLVNYLRGVEVWSDWRRTGFPVVQVVPDAMVDGIPQRIRTPAGEMERNSDNIALTGIPTGLEGMLVEVWWASGSPPQF
ncbi:MAG: SusD/RagB family nutrient-binding outer membrane lipoprotein [Gemmatimonadota bacterium]